MCLRLSVVSQISQRNQCCSALSVVGMKGATLSTVLSAGAIAFCSAESHAGMALLVKWPWDLLPAWTQFTALAAIMEDWLICICLQQNYCCCHRHSRTVIKFNAKVWGCVHANGSGLSIFQIKELKKKIKKCNQQKDHRHFSRHHKAEMGRDERRSWHLKIQSESN